MATFITRMDSEGAGPRLAVKDLIDVAGVPTTAGCKAVADRAEPAAADAACLAGARAAGASIVGKVNLHELAFGATGVNPWFGTPRNPLDAGLVPGGSSSGSAVAVADGDADVAFGSDTGGSVRMPSACCGTVGLKTTHGRVPLDGVWPLAVSLDTIGPMARDVAGVALGMELLEPGSTAPSTTPRVVGRLRFGADPAIEAALDEALQRSELEVVDVDLPGWRSAHDAALVVLAAEAYVEDGPLLDRRDGLGEDVVARLELGASISEAALADARARKLTWLEELAEVFTRVELLALPTLRAWPPGLGDADPHMTAHTAAVNLAGVPALSMPVPSGGPLPASLQLVGPAGSEAGLLAAGVVVEAAVS